MGKPLSSVELARLQELLRMDGVEWGDVVKYRGQKSLKAEFKDLAVKYLKWLLGASVGKIKFNAGGPAVSGEAILDGSPYVMISAGTAHLGVLYRAQKGSGNQWLPLHAMGDRGWYDALVPRT